MRKIWNKIVEWILSIPADKRMHFMAGFIIAAFFAIFFGPELSILGKWCIVPAFVAGVAKECYDHWTTNIIEWKDLLATTLGGVLPQLFVLLHLWIF